MCACHSRTHLIFSVWATIRRVLRFSIFLPLLAGCSIHPLPDDVSRKTTYDVVDKIRCEAKAAIEKYGQGFENASIVYSFTFDIDEVNGAVAGFTLFNPFANGTFNVNANGGSNRIRHGNRNFELIDSFDDLRKMNCTRDREVNWIYPITGDVGMFDSVATFIRLQKADNPGGTRIFTFADTLTYTTTFTGGVASTLTLAPVPEQFKFTAANASLGASRTDVHTVVVTMAAGHQTVIDRAGRRMVRRSVPFFDARVARSGVSRERDAGFAATRSGDPGNGGTGGSDGAAGVPGSFNNLLSTRILQQESSAENRALYEQDRQRQLELQRRSLDVRVLVGP